MLINSRFILVAFLFVFSSCFIWKPKVRFNGVYVEEGDGAKRSLMFYKFYENDSIQTTAVPVGFSISPKLLSFYRDCYFWGTWKSSGDSIFIDENILSRNKVVFNSKASAVFISRNKLRFFFPKNSDSTIEYETYDFKFKRFSNTLFSK